MSVTFTPDIAVKLSPLFKMFPYVTRLNFEENNNEKVENAISIQDRVAEILLKRALGNTNVLQGDRLLRGTRIMENGTLNFNDMFEYHCPNNEYNFKTKSLCFCDDGFDIARNYTSDNAVLMSISSILALNWSSDANDIDEDEIEEFFDNDEDYFLENMSDYEYEEVKSQVRLTIEALKNPAENTSEIEFVIHECQRAVDWSGEVISLKNNKETIENIVPLMMTCFDTFYDGTRNLYINKKLPSFYMHRDSFKDTPEKDALISAIEYLMVGKDLDAPGAEDFCILCDDYFLMGVNFGGFAQEGYTVDTYHEMPFFDVALMTVETLLPIVFLQNS